MTQTRSVATVRSARPTLEGAGVHLKRGFSFGQEKAFDPFLLFDDFSGDHPDQYMAGFPWHPHRGIETITYLLEGEVAHGDSLGNSGSIRPGEVQWMTAGSGIIHQEMPQSSPTGRLVGFQLWANLPASHKMMPPRYRGIEAADIPEVEQSGARLRIIGGTVDGVSGPARDIIIEPEYLDVTLQPGASWTHPTLAGHTVFAYLFQGGAIFAEGQPATPVYTIVLFDDGEQVRISAGDEGARFLLVSGKPLREPIAWGGPIVMNTEAELRQAFADYRAGTFIKHPNG